MSGGIENMCCDHRSLVERLRKVCMVFFDFDGVFTDNGVYVSQSGEEMVRCFRGDGLGLRKLDRFSIPYMVLSSEKNPVVLERCRKLGIDCVHGCDNKLETLKEILAERKLAPRQVAFVGNDSNDSDCLEHVGTPIVVRDAHADVCRHGYYRTAKCGGYGAVREICDLIAKGKAGDTGREVPDLSVVA